MTDDNSKATPAPGQGKGTPARSTDPGVESPADRNVERYRIAMFGGGIEEIDRYQLRDRIRQHEVTAATEVARAGTDDWRKTSQYPELAHYLELATTAPKPIGEVRASRAAPAESVGARLLPALLYPLAGGEVLVLLGIAICQSIPGVSLLMIPVTMVYVLAIIRATAGGKKKMPAWVETDDIPGMFSVWIRTVLVTFISLWPMFLWLAIWYFTTSDHDASAATNRLVPGLVVTGVLSLLYYPACLATIAVWDSVAASLNPVFIFRVVRTMGSDYVVAVLAWIAATGAAFLLGRALDVLLSMIPFSSVPHRMLSIWAQFFGAHLLGWAVHRHSVELGWD